MEYFTYNKKDGIKAKRKAKDIKTINRIYKRKFAPSNVIGQCTTLWKRLKPISHEDFEQKYHQYAENNIDKPIYERGLTRSELYQLTINFKKECEKIDNSLSFDLKFYYNLLSCHIITETHDGQINEEDLKNIAKKYGFEIEKNDYKRDALESIDIIAHNPLTNETYYIQCKPSTFFEGFGKETRPDITEDNQKLVNNANKLKFEKNIELYVCIHNPNKTNNKWIKNKRFPNKICHKITDIYNLNKSNEIINVKLF